MEAEFQHQKLLSTFHLLTISALEKHQKLLSTFHPLTISALEKHQMTVRKQREPLFSSFCISLLVFCSFFSCLFLEKRRSWISQPPVFTHANGNRSLHLLGAGIHLLRTTLRSSSNRSHQHWVGCLMPFVFSTVSCSSCAYLPRAAHGTKTAAS